MERYLTRKELFEIPETMMPMIVFSDNLRNIFSAGIKAHTHGCYGHMMWLVEPGVMASMQLNGYKRVKIESFLSGHRLKFWHCPDWGIERAVIRESIKAELSKKWWQGNRYDFISYIGQLTGWKWIQSPFRGVDVCSDKGKYLKLVDADYNLTNPDPQDVNQWLEDHKPKYQIYGRYTPD